jgi:integrase
MAQIQERVGRTGKVHWRVRVRLRGQRGQTATFSRKTDALHWAQRIEGDLRAGRHFPSNEARRRTLTELLDRYRAEVLPQYSRREQAQRSGKLSWWERQLGARRLADLSAASISECRARLARGEGLSGRPASAATQARYLATLKHVLSIARREWEWIDENPAERVRAPREPRGRVRYLSEAERDRLLAACRASRDQRLYPLVVVALGTGARQGELLRLRWEDIDFQRRTATVHKTKNDERRTLVLAGRVLRVLGELHAARRAGAEEIFAGPRDGASFPQEAWDDSVKQAQIADFRFHDLRHTFASQLAMSGATLAELADAMGHKTLAMVKRYAHLSEQHTSGVVGRYVERFLG